MNGEPITQIISANNHFLSRYPAKGKRYSYRPIMAFGLVADHSGNEYASSRVIPLIADGASLIPLIIDQAETIVQVPQEFAQKALQFLLDNPEKTFYEA